MIIKPLYILQKNNVMKQLKYIELFENFNLTESKSEKNELIIEDDGIEWHLMKMDGTHFKMNIGEFEKDSRPAIFHIAQINKSWYYKDVEKWLNGEDVPDIIKK